MKEIKLTQNQVALVDDEDFEWLNQYKWSINNAGYAQARVNGDTTTMHRLILPNRFGLITDHNNENRLDNRRSNLHRVSQSLNVRVAPKKANCTSKYKGVYFNSATKQRRKPWMAYAKIKGTKTFLGSFKTEEEAGARYQYIVEAQIAFELEQTKRLEASAI